ncbi:MAG: SDR family oxidoreductase [Deltaproteobacteria bacterium]|jgi:3-oxoacyl-[acyl-carrier protein] reductase|nr:MAG: SDR family oxidoreductase [Deltaproteobacteria bacterium]
MKYLITGSNSDISKALGHELLNLGHQVVFTCSTEASKNSAESYWSEKGQKVEFVVFNFTQPDKSEKEIQSLKIDGIILNAWKKVDELKDFHEFNDQEIDSELMENVKGNVKLLQQVLPAMVDKQFGRILYISSVAATSGTSKYGLYCLGKSALEGLIKNLAVDYGKYNITANILRPGIIKTERTKRFWSREYYAKRMSKGIPSARLGEPSDIARASLPFLEENCYMNGAEVNVSGGLPLISTAGALKDSKDQE